MQRFFQKPDKLGITLQGEHYFWNNVMLSTYFCNEDMKFQKHKPLYLSSSIGVLLPLQLILIGKIGCQFYQWQVKVKNNLNMLVSTSCFKQPFVNLGDQSVVLRDDSTTILQIKVQRAQSSFRSENDIVNRLLTYSYKCIYFVS